MNPKAKAILIAILTNIFTVLATLTIAVYFGELAIDIALPVWVHWIMPFIFVNWVRAIDT